MIWHSAELEDVATVLGTDISKGLANGVAGQRLEQYGSNTLSFKKRHGFFNRFFKQLNNFVIIALLVVAVVSLVVTAISRDNKWFNPLLIFIIVIVDAAVGAYQEIKSEDTTEILQDLSAPATTVLREGIKKVVDASQIVPGDIIILEAGDYIPADARIISSTALCCDESPLTGSHVPADKTADIIPEDITHIEERVNMIFAGCSVTHGSCIAVVTETGIRTEIGKEKSLLEQTGAAAVPVRETVSVFSKTFSIVTIIFCALVFIAGMAFNFRNHDISRTLIDTFMSSAALAVAAIPEGLPSTISVILALGIQRFLSKNAIIKNASLIETIGGVSVICADKTGTLTENKMTAVKVYNGNSVIPLVNEVGNDVKMILELATVCNNASESSGDPTGVGIAEACLAKTGMSKQDIENLYPRLGEVPFDSERRLMSTINMINGKPFAIVKGAPENLLPLCSGISLDRLKVVSNELAEDALRVIAVAAKALDSIPANPLAGEIENELNFIGLIGLEDNPRREAVKAVAECKKAGIRTVMLTGDHPSTAKAIARRLGILTDDTQVITSAELESMSDEELEAKIETYSVYARISSADRLRIVHAWQKKDHLVAATGDSVDDVPILMAADVGCSMGKSGTDVAKGVSDVILADDDFSSIVSAIREGRTVFANIRKVINYLISSNIGELILMFFGVLIFGRLPLPAAQLLWVNLVTDLGPVVAMGMEPPEKSIMTRPPEKKQTIFGAKVMTSVLWQGILIGGLSIVAYGIGLSGGVSAASTMAFAVVIFSQLLFSLSVRTEGNLLKAGFLSNPVLLISVAFSAILALLVMLTPLRIMFGLTALGASSWGWIIFLSIIPFVVSEIVKIVVNLSSD